MLMLLTNEHYCNEPMIMIKLFIYIFIIIILYRIRYYCGQNKQIFATVY